MARRQAVRTGSGVNRRVKRPRPIDLRIMLEDFGPLAKAEVELRPMTIFIGPNNSGKSYAAMMIYSLFRSYWDGDAGPPIYPRRLAQTGTTKLLHPARFLFKPFCEDVIQEILSRCAHLRDGVGVDVSSEQMRKLARAIFKEVSLEVLARQVSQIFSAELNELSRVARTPFKLGVRAGGWTARLQSQDGRLRLTRIDPGRLPAKTEVRFTAEVVMRSGQPRAEVDKELEAGFLRHTLASQALRPLWLQLDRGHLYVPPQRSGLLQTLETILQERIGSLSMLSGHGEVRPVMTGAATWFLRNLMLLGRQPVGPFANLATAMEREITGGEILVRNVNESAPPEFFYRFDGREIPLHRASSSVTELAGIILYLRYLVLPGGVLIIDEPEAHLHPNNQLTLAKYLVKLVREGVNVLITTHSDYLLDQLNNLLLVGKVKDASEGNDLKDPGQAAFLLPEEVAAYVFKYDRKREGYIAQRLKISDEEGLVEHEFSKVNEALYDELVSLRRQLVRQSEP